MTCRQVPLQLPESEKGFQERLEGWEGTGCFGLLVEVWVPWVGSAGRVCVRRERGTFQCSLRPIPLRLVVGWEGTDGRGQAVLVCWSRCGFRGWGPREGSAFAGNVGRSNAHFAPSRCDSWWVRKGRMGGDRLFWLMGRGWGDGQNLPLGGQDRGSRRRWEFSECGCRAHDGIG